MRYVYATEPGSLQRLGSPRRTAASLLAWLQANPNLTVSKPTTGRIGTVRARVVDIGVADGAVNDDPGCPAKACANFLGYPQWGEPYGIAGLRIYGDKKGSQLWVETCAECQAGTSVAQFELLYQSSPTGDPEAKNGPR